MEDIITRILTMNQYVDHAKVKAGEGFQVTTKELLTLAKFANQDLFGAIHLAFTYGRAKGYRAAKGLSPEIQHKPAPSAEWEGTEAHTMTKSLDAVQLQAVLTTMRALAAGAESAAALEAGNAILTAGGYPPVSVSIARGA